MAQTKDDIAAERDQLAAERDQLADQLRQLQETTAGGAGGADQLAAELNAVKAERAQLIEEVTQLRTAGVPIRAANPEPRFELSAGEQSDLQLHGVTRSVRTGLQIAASDYPEQVDLDQLSDDARAADARAVAARTA